MFLLSSFILLSDTPSSVVINSSNATNEWDAAIAASICLAVCICFIIVAIVCCRFITSREDKEKLKNELKEELDRENKNLKDKISEQTETIKDLKDKIIESKKDVLTNTRLREIQDVIAEKSEELKKAGVKVTVKLNCGPDSVTISSMNSDSDKTEK